MNPSNNELENILYNIIEELSKQNSPIIFKGALALKELLYLNDNKLDIDRSTVDIDANWINEYDKDKIIMTLEQAVKRVNPGYSIKLVREPSETRSMGFKIIDENDNVISKIDMDIKDNPFYIVCSINGNDIKFTNFNKIMTDKLLAISKEHIFRRTKDLIDIYLIISSQDISKKDIDEILEFEQKELGDFSTLLENKDLVKQSYDKLIGINNKPDFEVVWDKLYEYLTDEKFINISKDIEREL